MTTKQEHWLKLDGVEVERGGRQILRGLTTSLGGRAIGLVGANGAGKSTLIGAMLGVLPMTRGTMQVIGINVSKNPMELRVRSGVMAEQAGVFPGSTGVDAVAFAGMLNGLKRRESLRRAHRALDALAVGEERYRATDGYSTGMKQKTKLAMCLVHDPELLILDEPTVGLDPPSRAQLLRLICELRDEGRNILMSTHIMNDAEVVCDEMLIIDNGAIKFSGPVADLTEGADRSELVMAKGRALGLEVTDKLRESGVEVKRIDDNAIRFIVRDDDDLRHFWKSVAEADGEVWQLTEQIRTLEDGVLDVMERPHET